MKYVWGTLGIVALTGVAGAVGFYYGGRSVMKVFVNRLPSWLQPSGVEMMSAEQLADALGKSHPTPHGTVTLGEVKIKQQKTFKV